MFFMLIKFIFLFGINNLSIHVKELLDVILKFSANFNDFSFLQKLSFWKTSSRSFFYVNSKASRSLKLVHNDLQRPFSMLFLRNDSNITCSSWMITLDLLGCFLRTKEEVWQDCLKIFTSLGWAFYVFTHWAQLRLVRPKTLSLNWALDVSTSVALSFGIYKFIA